MHHLPSHRSPHPSLASSSWLLMSSLFHVPALPFLHCPSLRHLHLSPLSLPSPAFLSHALSLYPMCLLSFLQDAAAFRVSHTRPDGSSAHTSPWRTTAVLAPRPPRRCGVGPPAVAPLRRSQPHLPPVSADRTCTHSAWLAPCLHASPTQRGLPHVCLLPRHTEGRAASRRRRTLQPSKARALQVGEDFRQLSLSSPQVLESVHTCHLYLCHTTCSCCPALWFGRRATDRLIAP